MASHGDQAGLQNGLVGICRMASVDERLISGVRG